MQATAPVRRRGNAHRWIRQLHLWIGAWGALAAILYGLTGLVMNHRFGENAWPQGASEDNGRNALTVPAEARGSAEALSLWLRTQHGLEAQVIRKGRPGADASQPRTWSLSGGSARRSWSLEFAPGSATAELKRSTHSPLAAFNRLHKGVGGSGWWILLADSFAIGMVLLGISGIWMWARGRRPRELLLSVLGLSTLVFCAVVGLALL